MGIALASLFLLTAVVSLVFAGLRLRVAKASPYWPSVKGRLTKVEMWGTRNVDGEMVQADRLRVAYEYSVDGRVLIGTELAHYTLMFPETLDFAKRHSENSGVEVFYKPKDPLTAVLIRGPRKDKPLSEIIISALACVGSLVALYVQLH